MTQLYRQPFETKISFNQFTNSEQQELGKRLREWYKTEIDSKRKLIDRIFVDFWLLNGNQKILPLHRCESRLQKMFEGDYTFSVDQINDNVSSDEVVPFFISMFTSITFHLTKEPQRGNYRDDHESGFFPYRLKEECKQLAPILEPYQIYYRIEVLSQT